jgi:NDP-sugar pyrophosphorylase family protein
LIKYLAILAVNYGKEQLEQYFQEHESSVPVILNPETEPLGTGGAIKNADKLINDTFIVFNGDVITSLDMPNFVNFHRKSGGIGTLALWYVKDPSRFGIIAVNDSNMITRFLEKPKPEEVFSHLINAGTYCLEPEILDLIPSGRKVSIEREIFPNILDNRLFGLEFKGYWFDAGTPEIYIETHKQMFDYYSKKGGLQEKLGANSIVSTSARVEDSVIMGRDCTIGDNTIIGPYVFLGNSVQIGSGCSLSNAVVHDGTTILDNVHGNNIILGLDNNVTSDQNLPDGLVTGDGFKIDVKKS